MNHPAARPDRLAAAVASNRSCWSSRRRPCSAAPPGWPVPPHSDVFNTGTDLFAVPALGDTPAVGEHLGPPCRPHARHRPRPGDGGQAAYLPAGPAGARAALGTPQHGRRCGGGAVRGGRIGDLLAVGPGSPSRSTAGWRAPRPSWTSRRSPASVWTASRTPGSSPCGPAASPCRARSAACSCPWPRWPRRRWAYYRPPRARCSRKASTWPSSSTPCTPTGPRARPSRPTRKASAAGHPRLPTGHRRPPLPHHGSGGAGGSGRDAATADRPPAAARGRREDQLYPVLAPALGCPESTTTMSPCRGPTARPPP